MKTKEAEDKKKWDITIICDDTDSVFKVFNKLYDKSREAARYYLINKDIRSLRYVAFVKKNVHIIVCEQISYGVSITLKRYKSTKVLEKYYVDTNNGSITKSIRGKFIPCKSSDISATLSQYIISKMKWIGFVFKLQLPVTFTTIVTKKLYSEKKLLSWFWGTNYPTALKLSSALKNNGSLYELRKNIKNVKNIDKLNIDFYAMEIFMPMLRLAVKTRKIINCAWSQKRMILENNKMNRLVLDELYENFNYSLKIDDIFLSMLSYIKSYGYIVPETSKELSKICNSVDKVQQYLTYYGKNFESDKNIVIKKNNLIILLRYGTKYSFSGNNKHEEFFSWDSYYTVGSYTKSDDVERVQFLENLNKYYITHLKSEERKNKLIKIKLEVVENL